jgi:hypothetical protein
MMKRTILLLLLAACLLSIGTVTAQIDRNGPEPGYRIERIVSGDGYHLDSLNWQFSGVSSSSKYLLLSQPNQQTFASGCCCAYLPCTLRGP